jgi:hypothetical protein
MTIKIRLEIAGIVSYNALEIGTEADQAAAKRNGEKRNENR